MWPQNIKTKDFILKGTVVGLRESDDQKFLSYNMLTVMKPPGKEDSSGHCSLMRKSLKIANKMQGVM